MIKKLIQIILRCFNLAAPFGKKKVLVLLVLVLLNGVLEVIGVTSILPFLALATNSETDFTSNLTNIFPDLSHRQLLFLMGIFSIVLLLISNLVGLTSQVMRVRYSQNLGHYLRMSFLNKVSEQSYAYFLNRNTSSFIQKSINDISTFINMVFIPLFDIISKCILITFLIVLVLLVDATVAISTATVLGVFYFSALLFFRKRSQKVGEVLKETNLDLLVKSQELFGAIKTILVHGKSDYFISEVLKNSKEQATCIPKTTFYSFAPRSLVEPVALGGIVVAILILSSRGENLVDALPVLSLFAVAGLRLLPAFQSVYAALNTLMSRMYTIDEVEEEILKNTKYNEDNLEGGSGPTTEVDFNGDIVLDNLTFQYEKSLKPSIENLSFTIPENSSLGIVGQTGSGKSTLVDLILGLHVPTKGEIKVNNITLSSNNVERWREKVAYVPQDIFLLDSSITANIAFGIPLGEIDHNKLKSAARAAQILEFIERELPESWDTVIGERGVRLSGGQRQRIGLARALYHKPTVLILDEATSALDNETEKEVMAAINQLQGTMTIIAIAHRLSSISHMDRILDLSEEKNLNE